MRIGFIGAGATGKSSTAEALAALSGLPYHKSVTRGVFQQQFNMTQSEHTRLPAEKRWEMQQAAFIAKMEQDTDAREGIFERTLLDHYTYCLIHCAEAISDDDHKVLQDEVRANLAAYDLLYYFPLYSWAETAQRDDGFRVGTMANLTLLSCFLEGWLEAHASSISVIVLDDLPATDRAELIYEDIRRVERQS